jgi:hypothetical protein
LKTYRGGFFDFNPSWVPDFVKSIYPPWIPLPEHVHASSNMPTIIEIARVSDKHSTPMLHLQTIMVGRIARLGNAFRPGAPPTGVTCLMPGEILFMELQGFLNDANSKYTAL